jgi:membrane protein CcdC involved in cytochrome C biogenesis
MVPLVAWRIYSRYRRLVGRQLSKKWRHWTAAVLFPLLLVLLAIPALLRPLSLEALGGGVVVGIVLAVIGLKRTRFEATPEGFFFTPHTGIGVALLTLMVSRIAYRFFQMSQMDAGAAPPGMQDFARSPLTLVIIGMVLAYYTTYAIGLLRWRARTIVASAPSESPS